jgi:hypothetical protein
MKKMWLLSGRVQERSADGKKRIPAAAAGSGGTKTALRG